MRAPTLGLVTLTAPESMHTAALPLTLSAVILPRETETWAIQQGVRQTQGAKRTHNTAAAVSGADHVRTARDLTCMCLAL